VKMSRGRSLTAKERPPHLTSPPKTGGEGQERRASCVCGGTLVCPLSHSDGRGLGGGRFFAVVKMSRGRNLTAKRKTPSPNLSPEDGGEGQERLASCVCAGTLVCPLSHSGGRGLG